MSQHEVVPPNDSQRIVVEVSAGELIDKLVILEIKRARLRDPEKLANVEREWIVLAGERNRKIRPAEEMRDEFAAAVLKLREVNEALWQIEDDIRDCERLGDFGPRFVELARSVYHTNDQRSRWKRAINELLGSRLVEEKQYAAY
jgi:hypothetical protein